ncbi:MAG: hypothetical protein JO103_01050 [Candidatus Eremiobacteraeota bacterium]|nr:hypothetical protein [Candidatus Eremiobacteraeota bacterium]
MRPRQPAALGLWAALTLACAVLVHGAVHAVGAGSLAYSGPHLVELTAAVALLAAVAAPLGLVGTARERRRRLALVRASLGPPTARIAAFGLAVQAAVAGLLFVAEGASVDPDRLALTVLSALVALLASAFLFRAARDRVVAVLTALVEVLAPAPPRATTARRAAPPARATVPFRLFVPNRPPPLAA